MRAEGSADDVDRVLRAQQGDTAAFESLVEKHRDRVYGLALRLTRSEADAAEVTQDTFLSAFEHLDSFRGEAAFGSWVHRIAANHALMRVRRRRVAESTELVTGAPFDERGVVDVEKVSDDVVRDADAQMLDRELRTAIEQATDRLPEEHREVFLLRDVDGLSYDEIAELTGVTVAAVKSRLHRARLTLRDAIVRFYGSEVGS